VSIEPVHAHRHHRHRSLGRTFAQIELQFLAEEVRQVGQLEVGLPVFFVLWSVGEEVALSELSLSKRLQRERQLIEPVGVR
jgi:hypothetical protein